MRRAPQQSRDPIYVLYYIIYIYIYLCNKTRMQQQSAYILDKEQNQRVPREHTLVGRRL